MTDSPVLPGLEASGWAGDYLARASGGDPEPDAFGALVAVFSRGQMRSPAVQLGASTPQQPLSVDDFEAILKSTHASLVKQYQALLATEGVALDFSDEGIRRLAQIACDVNERTENIGARRLATVMEHLLDEVSFDAARRQGQTVVIDAAYVDARLGELSRNEDLSRYIL
jgi:hypothetical protein